MTCVSYNSIVALSCVDRVVKCAEIYVNSKINIDPIKLDNLLDKSHMSEGVDTDKPHKHRSRIIVFESPFP